MMRKKKVRSIAGDGEIDCFMPSIVFFFFYFALTLLSRIHGLSFNAIGTLCDLTGF